MKSEVELFTLEAAEAEQAEWGPELRAFAGMVSVIRERHFGKSISEDRVLEMFEALVETVEIDHDETD